MRCSSLKRLECYFVVQAKFNMGDHSNAEEWIVTSTGHLVITWDFRRVKQNRLGDYKVLIKMVVWYFEEGFMVL